MDTQTEQALDAAHLLICWTFQHMSAIEPSEAQADGFKWRVWHLDPDARDQMNASQQSLFDALMKMKQ